MEKELNIFEKMSKITEEINKVAKNLKVGVGQAQYKAVGEADVLEAVKPIEIKFGVYSYPLSRKIIKDEILTSIDTYENANGETVKKERNTVFMRIETIYRFVNVEKPDEYIDITTYGDGVDSNDKAPGKAMTYSDKYALLKAYKIETGDDPDQKMSENLPNKKKIEKEPLDKELLKKCEELEVSLDDVASYFKVDKNNLKNEHLKFCVETKEKAIAKKKAKEAEIKNDEVDKNVKQ